MNAKIDIMEDKIVTSIKETLGGRIDQLEGKVLDLELENQKLKEELDRIKQDKPSGESKQMATRMMTAERRIVELEQYSRNSSIKMMGVPEDEKEDTWAKVLLVLNEKLEVKVSVGWEM